MSKLYDVRPSVLLDIPDAYTSYCFDEACAYITSRIKDGEEPDFSVVENISNFKLFQQGLSNNNIEKPHYNSLSDMYASMGYKNGRYKKQLNE